MGIDQHLPPPLPQKFPITPPPGGKISHNNPPLYRRILPHFRKLSKLGLIKKVSLEIKREKFNPKGELIPFPTDREKLSI
jgi:hypothetical protein